MVCVCQGFSPVAEQYGWLGNNLFNSSRGNRDEGSRAIWSLLEILRVYVQLYVEASFFFGLASYAERNPDGISKNTLSSLRECLSKLKSECEKAEALCSLDKLSFIDFILETQDLSTGELVRGSALTEHFRTLSGILSSELSHRFFFSIDSARKRILENPFGGWEEVIDRFPGTISDIEEMRKCYVFSRYPACVFYSMQVIEHGIIALGACIGTKDHKPGWVATTSELKALLKLPMSLAQPGKEPILDSLNK